MSGTARLEFRNGTPFPVTWIHLEREGEEPARGRENLLELAVPPNRAVLLESVVPGAVRPVLGLHVEDGVPHGDRCVGPWMKLAAGDARTVGIRFDRDAGFSIEHRDGRVYRSAPDGTVQPTGTYTWSGSPASPRR